MGERAERVCLWVPRLAAVDKDGVANFCDKSVIAVETYNWHGSRAVRGHYRQRQHYISLQENYSHRNSSKCLCRSPGKPYEQPFKHPLIGPPFRLVSQLGTAV